jgi:hypothetical protein
LALRGVGPKSEAESVRFHGRRVTKWARKSNTDVSGIGGVRVACRGCGKVKRERLDFLADNPLYTTVKFECSTNSGPSLAKLCGFNEPKKMEIEHG